VQDKEWQIAQSVTRWVDSRLPLCVLRRRLKLPKRRRCPHTGAMAAAAIVCDPGRGERVA